VPVQVLCRAMMLRTRLATGSPFDDELDGNIARVRLLRGNRGNRGQGETTGAHEAMFRPESIPIFAILRDLCGK